MPWITIAQMTVTLKWEMPQVSTVYVMSGSLKGGKSGSVETAYMSWFDNHTKEFFQFVHPQEVPVVATDRLSLLC